MAVDEGRATIVVLTYNRRAQAMNTVAHLLGLPGNWPVIVVDNGSIDGTADAIEARYPSVMVIRARRNLGAAGRNIAVAYVHTPYVAFCDDDTQWEPGSIERAVELLDAAPHVAVVNARIEVGVNRLPDPTCVEMAHSPLPRSDLPGPQLLGFMAGACVMRTRAFYEAGGYWPPFFIGGEEELMALDLVDKGWRIIYAPDVVTRHFPLERPGFQQRDRLLLRNAIWVAWMRRPFLTAVRRMLVHLNEAGRKGILLPVLLSAMAGFPRAISRRRVTSPEVEHMRRLLDAAVSGSPEGLKTGETLVGRSPHWRQE